MSDDRQEAEFITNEIAQRTRHGERGARGFRDPLPHERAVAPARDAPARSCNIPYRVIGGKSFFDAREIKDLLAYASVLLNADDDVSLLRIINTPGARHRPDRWWSARRS